MSRREILVLGGRDLPRGPSDVVKLGWHLQQLHAAADRRNVDMQFADYESLRGCVNVGGESMVSAWCQSYDGNVSAERKLANFDAILTRTMPAGSLEQITFRLATLHHHVQSASATTQTLFNSPAGLEIAIDKYATLARVASLGIPIPPTMVAQSRATALEAFDKFGGDVVVKPIFGGEGRGVMRIRDAELAWTTFSTLAQLGAVCYVQQFISPGGVDLRLLVIGDQIHAIRRRNSSDFRTNVRGGGRCEWVTMQSGWRKLAHSVCDAIGLRIAAVDLIEDESGDLQLIEVNGIPGWKGAQSVVKTNIADEILNVLLEQS